jgi:PEGA domain
MIQMRKILLLLISVVSIASAQKTVHVNQYTRKDGTVVSAYDRNAPGTATSKDSGNSVRSTATPSSSTGTAAEGTVSSEASRRALATQTCVIQLPEAPSTLEDSGAQNASSQPGQQADLKDSAKSKPSKDRQRARTPAISAVTVPQPPSSLIAVNVTSTPPGASILVDGYPGGVTPAAVRLAPGTYTFALKALGLPECSYQMTVEAGHSAGFSAHLNGSN